MKLLQDKLLHLGEKLNKIVINECFSFFSLSFFPSIILGFYDTCWKVNLTYIPSNLEVICSVLCVNIVAHVFILFRCNAVTDSDLELSIEWLTDGKLIDFDQEPRFVQQSDSSLSITKTTELDSGVYTCVASTELDKVTAAATLIVQGMFLQNYNATIGISLC